MNHLKGNYLLILIIVYIYPLVDLFGFVKSVLIDLSFQSLSFENLDNRHFKVGDLVSKVSVSVNFVKVTPTRAAAAEKARLRRP